MGESKDTSLAALWYVIVVTLIIANLLVFAARGVITTNLSTNLTNLSNGSNAVTNVMAAAADVSGHIVDATGTTIGHGARTIASATAHGGAVVGRGVAHGTVAVGRATWDSAAFVGRGLIGGLAFAADTTAHTLQFVASAAIMNPLARPADKLDVPVISKPPAALPAVAAASAASAPAAAPSPSATGVQWPLHGIITTLFGVPELPYEAIHTGLDISDGTAPGTTPIRPFKPGTVIEVIRSGYGLGNHVVIDHGGGMTSVYGHMYSIAVQVGQQVDDTTVLGLEGSTGVSTGTHLHFEIRINGVAVNPLNYIPGRP